MKTKLTQNITFRTDAATYQRLKDIGGEEVDPSQLIRLALAEKMPAWERHGVRFPAASAPRRSKPCPPPSGN